MTSPMMGTNKQMTLDADRVKRTLERQIEQQTRLVNKHEKRRLRRERGDRRTTLERQHDELCRPDMSMDEMAQNMGRLQSKVGKRVYRGAEEGLTYQQMCRMLRAARNRQKRCCPDGKDDCSESERRVCCQHITKDGTRCQRAASRFTSLSLGAGPGPNMEPPGWLRKHLKPAQFNRLALSMAGLNCCFYCWQHAGAALLRGVTLVNSTAFFVMNPTVIVRLFFPEFRVERRTVLGIPVSFRFGKIRTSANLLKLMRDALAGGEDLPGGVLEAAAVFGSAVALGPFNARTVFWLVFMSMRAVVFMADKLGPLTAIVGRRRMNDMAVESAKALSSSSTPAPPTISPK